MKNQCRVCVRERTMKAQTEGTILFACFAIATLTSHLVAGVEVSSQVDLDSDENEDTPSNIALDATEDPSKCVSTLESVSRASTQPIAGWRRDSELVRSREPRKRRIYTARVSEATIS